ncbi:hypothetical protein HK100_008075, partial [Physocladia obscura]
MASFENKTASDETAQKVAATTQKIVLLTEQNTKVLKALKEAKKHILTQDKQIKDLKAVAPKDNFMEAIQSYEAQLAEKTAEVERAKKELHDTRRAAKREQALMLSAWYSLGISQQRQSGGQQQQLGVNGKPDVTPLSWLAQQRKDATIHGRHPRNEHTYEVQERKINSTLSKVGVPYFGSNEPIVIDVPEKWMKMVNPTRANINQSMKEQIIELEETVKRLQFELNDTNNPDFEKLS